MYLFDCLSIHLLFNMDPLSSFSKKRNNTDDRASLNIFFVISFSSLLLIQLNQSTTGYSERNRIES